MRVRTTVLAGLAGVLLHGQAARADDPWYVSGSFGGYFRESQSISTTFYKIANPQIAASGTNHQTFDTGLNGNLAVGYELFPQIRVEAEIGYVEYSGSTISPFTTNPNFPRLNGSTFTRQAGDGWSRFTGTVNAFYDFEPLAGLTPYIGAGIGAAADHRTIGIYTNASGGVFRSGGGASTEGLALLEAGIGIPLMENLTLVPAYRFIHYFAGNEDVAHIVKVGLRYSF